MSCNSLISIKNHLSLFHSIEYRLSDKHHTDVIEGVEFTSHKAETVVFGRPLAGGPWAAIYEPAWTRGHRRVFYTRNGKARFPGRFAIDFIRLDMNGMYAEGDENYIENWHGYGTPVLAVTDGIVASVRNDFHESNTLDQHPKYSAGQATGNYVSLDIGNGNFVFYEHLKPNSIKVEPGEKVSKGDVIGAIGFTGQTTGPHLHLHLANRNSPLGAEGLPFVFEQFAPVGSYKKFENFGKKKWTSTVINDTVYNERPAPNTVLIFNQ